jgi:hypothetical protein
MLKALLSLQFLLAFVTQGCYKSRTSTGEYILFELANLIKQ